MKKRKDSKEDIHKNLIKKQINRHLIFEIIFLFDFIVLLLLDISLTLLIPILVIVFSILEFRIERLRKDAGYLMKSRLLKVSGEIISFLGFLILILSPFIIELVQLLAIPIILIVSGTFLLLVSKFYDSKK